MDRVSVTALMLAARQARTGRWAYLRLATVTGLRGRSRSATYLDIANGLCTAGAAIGPATVGWPSYEIDTLNCALLAGLPADNVRLLVSELHGLRQEMAVAA